MSVKINNMSGTAFTATPSGVTKTVTDNSTLASTTAFVKTYISFLIPLADTLTVASTITFSTIYATLVKGVSSLTLRGNLSVGQASTTVNLLGNPINVSASYPGILTSPTLIGAKIQVGTRFAGGGSSPIGPPISPVAGSIAFSSGSINANNGTMVPSGTGFNLRSNASTFQTSYWIMFN
jgi:hypothetical protein